MIDLLIGTWPRRILTIGACILAFAISLTAAMAVAMGKAPQTIPQAQRIPALGALALAAAERIYGPLQAPADNTPRDVPTIRVMRPMSAEEIGQLIQSLKNERQACADRTTELDREGKRLDLYRQEVSKEREEIVAMREKIAAQWDELQKARSGLDRHVTEIQGMEAKNLKQLAASYEAMKPDKAAAVLKKLDEATAAKTLFLMKERAAAKVIEQLDQDTAAKLTERMTLIKQEN